MIELKLFGDNSIQKNEKQKDDFAFFCRTMGLNKAQIDFIFNSTFIESTPYEPNVEDYLDSKSFKTEGFYNFPDADRLINTNDIKKIATSMTRQTPKDDEEAKKIFDSFKNDLKEQDVTMEQYASLRSYTEQNYYEDFNKYMRLGKEQFFKFKVEQFLDEIKNNYEKQKLVDKYKVLNENIDNMRTCISEILTRCARDNLFEKKEINDVLDRYSSVVVDILRENNIEIFARNYSIVELMCDNMKSALGFSYKGIKQPTILHRVISVETFHRELGILSKDTNLTKDNLLGRVIQNDAFTSTSIDSTIINKRLLYKANQAINASLNDINAYIYLEILAPSGTKGLNIGKMSRYINEYEVVLAPNDLYIYDINEKFYFRGVTKITCIAISKDISDYPALIPDRIKNPEIER